MVNFDSLTLYENDSLFTFEVDRSYSIEQTGRPTDPLLSISVGVSPDMISIERTSYTLLDLLSDIGGI